MHQKENGIKVPPSPLCAFLLFSGSPETVKELNDIPKYLRTQIAKTNRGNEMPDIACDVYIHIFTDTRQINKHCSFKDNLKLLVSATCGRAKVHTDWGINPQNRKDCRRNCPYPVTAYQSRSNCSSIVFCILSIQPLPYKQYHSSNKHINCKVSTNVKRNCHCHWDRYVL